MRKIFGHIFKLCIVLLATGFCGASGYAGDCAHMEDDPAFDGWCAGQTATGDRQPAGSGVTGTIDTDQQRAEDHAAAQAFIEMFELNKTKTLPTPPGPGVDRNDATMSRGDVAKEVNDILSGEEVKFDTPSAGER